MTSDDLQATWKSTHNRFSDEQQREEAQGFVRQMKRRRRFQMLWLANTFFLLAVVTGLAMWSIALGKVELASQWALLPLLALPWLFAFHFLRQYLNADASRAPGELSIADSLCAALAANRNEQSHLKKVAVLFSVLVPLLVLAMHQLQSAGKLSRQELGSMAIFYAGVLLLSAAGILARYFGRVLPQQRKISAVLADLEAQ